MKNHKSFNWYSMKQKFSLRKYHFGLASVFLGAVLVTGAEAASAEEQVQAEDQAALASPVVETSADEVADTSALEVESSPEAEASGETATSQADESTSETVENPSPEASTSEADDQPQEDVAEVASFSTRAASATVANSSVVVRDTVANSKDVTLTHGDNVTRLVTISSPFNVGDVITVEVPKIFSATTDRDKTGNTYTVTTGTESTDADYETTKASSNTTFTYEVKTQASLDFGVRLVPTVADWSFLKEGAVYELVVKRNGLVIDKVTYTIDAPATVTNAEVNFDQNQTANGNLVPDQKYAVGVRLENNGLQDGDNFVGTATIKVPSNFTLDTEAGNGYGLNDNGKIGDTDTSFGMLADGSVKVSQPGGKGAPVILEFNRPKTSLNAGNIMFWGTYDSVLDAASNVFEVEVEYTSTNSDNERSKEAMLKAQGSLNVNLPVTADQKANLETKFTNKNGVLYTDNGTASGAHQKDNRNLDYGSERIIEVYNNGNVAQTNVNIHIDVEPGSVIMGGRRQDDRVVYGLEIKTSSENQIDSIVATLTDGTKVRMADEGVRRSNVNSLIFPPLAQIAPDGSNIAAFDIVYKNIEAGSKVELKFANNSILTEATSKRAGDTAEFAYKVTSDQGADESDTMTLPIQDPQELALLFTGKVTTGPRGTYLPTSEGGTTAEIAWEIRNSVNGTLEKPSSYLISIPKGFDVDASTVGIYMYEQLLSDAKLTDLGYIGSNDERMFRVDLPITPSYAAPVYIRDINDYRRNVTITAQEDMAPAHYFYRDDANKMSLFMAIDDNGMFSNEGRYTEWDITLKDGTSYHVAPAIPGWHTNGREADYTFTYSSSYGMVNGMKSDEDKRYNGNYDTTKPTENITSHNYSDNKNVSNDTGSIRLINVLTDQSTSDYSYNVVNLPSVEDGNNMTIRLTGEGQVSTTGTTGNGTLYYATKELDVSKLQQQMGPNGEVQGYIITEADLAEYVTASQVTDWSAIKSVVLRSNRMEQDATATAILPYQVTGLKDGLETAIHDVKSYFAGDHAGVVYSVTQDNRVFVQRYVNLETHWIQEDENGNRTVLQDPTTDIIVSGDPYTTVTLAGEKIPQGYQLKEVPSNAVGTMGSTNVVVEYVYVPVMKDLERPTKQTVTFEGAGDKTPPADVQDDYKFVGKENVATGTITWEEDSHTYGEVKVPVVEGYYADKAVAGAKTVTPDNLEVTDKVVYKELGKVIPVDPDGNPISNVPTPQYKNDPTDPTKGGETPVPEIPGYRPEVPSVTPTNPGEDTPVVYVKVEQKARVTYVDVTTSETLETVELGGKSGEAVGYSTQERIAYYTGRGYELVEDGYPSDATYDLDENVTQEWVVTLKHGTDPVGPENPRDPDTPINPEYPEGPKWPAKDAYEKEVKSTVHYVVEDGKVPAPADNVQTAKWTRTLTIDKVTGEVVDATDWASDKTNYEEVKTSVLPGYYADKATVPAKEVTQEDLEETVTYKPLGKVIPVDPDGNPIPNVPTPQYKNDPTDPTKGGETPVPEIPGYRPEVPSVTPTNPGEDTPVIYVPITPDPEPKPEPQPEPKPEPQPQPEPKPEPQPQPQAEVKSGVLPNTGEASDMLYFTGAAASILAGLGLLVTKKRKEEE